MNIHNYKPALTRSSDFKTFWDKRRDTSKPVGKIDWLDHYPVKQVRIADVTLSCRDGTSIRSWMILPNTMQKQIPAVIHFPGYTAGRGAIHEFLKYALMGVAVFCFEPRGQGISPDRAAYNRGNFLPGWMATDLQSLENYYYVHVYEDMMMYLSWIKGLTCIDQKRIAVMGESQGGGIALAAAGLDSDIKLVISDFPFLSHIEKGLELASEGPYVEVTHYFKYNDPKRDSYQQIMRNLSYVDAMNFCPDITCHAHMSIGMKDTVTPPETVFAAYNHLASATKEIDIYPDYGHEPNHFKEERRLEIIAKYLL
ncbi:MAG: acetylxylan esterase [Bacillota bacterium]